MNKKTSNWKKSINQDPNQPSYLGEVKVDKVSLRQTSYRQDFFETGPVTSLDKLDRSVDKKHWLDLVGLQDVDKLVELCKLYKIHPLTIEDILNTSQNSKLEEYENYLFINLKELDLGQDSQLETSQLSIVYMENTILCFRESSSPLFDSIYRKLELNSPLRELGLDFLLYEILDHLVDDYFLILDHISQVIDRTEDQLLIDPQQDLLHQIYEIKRLLIYLRKILWPSRNILNKLAKDDYYHISRKTSYYFRDIYDHIIQMIDIVETYRDICSGMLDTYLSSVSNKTNDIMKLMTIFSTISVPLTFLTGVYGMNFINQPELHFRYGYHIFWVLAVIITGGMLYYFKKKDWF